MNDKTRLRAKDYTEFVEPYGRCICVYKKLDPDTEVGARLYHSFDSGEFFCVDMVSGHHDMVRYINEIEVFFGKKYSMEAIHACHKWHSYLNGTTNTHPCLEHKIINKVVVI